MRAPLQVIISEFVNSSCNSATARDDSPAECRRGVNLYALAVSIYAFGGFVGALIGGQIADRIGRYNNNNNKNNDVVYPINFFRKLTLLINNAFALAGALMMALSHSFPLLTAGRFIIGINGGRERPMKSSHRLLKSVFIFIFFEGISTTIAPVYLAEVAPVRLRGALGTAFQVGVVSFIFISQLLGIPQVRLFVRFVIGFSISLCLIKRHWGLGRTICGDFCLDYPFFCRAFNWSRCPFFANRRDICF